MSVKISYIFWCLILGLIFWVFGATWYQKARFLEPLGAQLGPKWRPKSPKWRKNCIHFSNPWPLFWKPGTDLLPRSLSECSLAPFWSILDWFCMAFDGLLHNCWCISEAFFAIIFADCQRRPTRSELAANIKNIQISAETCKIQTQTKNADANKLIDNLQYAECNQLHQTPIVENGGRR